MAMDEFSEEGISPKSSLKAIYETLKFELFHMADRWLSKGVGIDAAEFSSCRSMSDGKPEEDVDEFAAKCFESDLELNIQLNCLCGMNEKKSVVILKRMTRKLTLVCWGDFNIIRSDDEKVSGIFRASLAKVEFNSAIQEYGLIDLPWAGQRLSWCNGRLGSRRVWARLDRVLVNVELMNLFEGGRVEYLSRTTSDLCPMLVSLLRERICGARPFCFQRMWGSHEYFLLVVKECWSQSVKGCPMVQVSKKVKLLKKALQKWNVEVFGRVEVRIKEIEKCLLELEQEVNVDYLEEREAALLLCKQDHLQWLQREEILGCQKSRIKWLSKGDSNMATLRVKKKNKVVDRINIPNGQALESVDDVYARAVNFFRELLTTSSVDFDEDALDLLKPLISKQENSLLCAPPSLEEVRAALWSIPHDSSPDPNGYMASFFMNAWEIVNHDLLAMAREFF
ncbi:uncharacterized protein LOC118348412 [Juglans regia]|uniref:Uncharacterized protein LOC118348412 n=1 Tax=Juglans regia TaxID=51240 RepID=A0A6P9ECG6_JUGRE|nr:uncharacterized protein LOC118348412 [Juglans regia]